MNRAERRKALAQSKRDLRDIKADLRRNQEKVLNDTRVECMFLIFVLVLHRGFGFGKKRCLKAMKAIDKLMGSWIKGTLDLEKLRELVEKEVGIRVEI